MEWTSHSTEREDEKDMRRLEKKARCGDLYGQMEKLRMDGESLRKTVDILSAQAVDDSLMEIIQQHHQKRMAELVAFLEELRSRRKIA